MLLLSSHTGTHSMASFFCCCKRGLFISQLCLVPILIGQIWNFAAYQNRFCPLAQRVWNSFEPAVEREIWCLEVWSFFSPELYSENVNKIVHFIHHCIFHSVVFQTVFIICINDFCYGRTISLKWVTVHSLSETHGSQHSIDWLSTARLTALTIAVASKAINDALYHWTSNFCI